MKVIFSRKIIQVSSVVIVIVGLVIWKLQPNIHNTKQQETPSISGISPQADNEQLTQATAQVKPQSTEQNTTAAKVATDADKQQALDLYQKGLKLYYARDFNEGLSYFNQALELDPNCYQAINGKGATYAFQGRYSEGISLIKQAIDMNPAFEYAHFNLGLAYELEGLWDSAINAYQFAIKLNSKDEWAYYGIASIYGRQGNVQQVVLYLKQAIALNPDCKLTAREEKDFDPVRNSPEFENLIK